MLQVKSIFHENVTETAPVATIIIAAQKTQRHREWLMVGLGHQISEVVEGTGFKQII